MDALQRRSIPIQSLENFLFTIEVKATDDNICIVYVDFIFIPVFEQ